MGATMALASAVLRTMERAMLRAGERRPQTAVDRLVARLTRLFPGKQVRLEAEVRGSSTHAWQVDAMVATERGLALFDFVSPAPVSVAFAAAKFCAIPARTRNKSFFLLKQRDDCVIYYGDSAPALQTHR